MLSITIVTVVTIVSLSACGGSTAERVSHNEVVAAFRTQGFTLRRSPLSPPGFEQTVLVSASPVNSDHFQVWVFRLPAEAETYRAYVEGPDYGQNDSGAAIKETATARNVLLLIMTSSGPSEQQRLLAAINALS